MLGRAETIAGFETTVRRRSIPRRGSTRARPARDRALTLPPAGQLGRLPCAARLAEPARTDTDVQRDVDHVLLARYAPACVLVDENLDVVQFRGRTGPYLEQPAGPAAGQPPAHGARRARGGAAARDPARAAHGCAGAARTTSRSAIAAATSRYPSRGRFRSAATARRSATSSSCSRTRRPRRHRGARASQRSKPARGGDDARAGAPGARCDQGVSPHRSSTQHARRPRSSASRTRSCSRRTRSCSRRNEELQTAKEELQSTNEELETVNERAAARQRAARARSTTISSTCSTSVDIAIIIVDARAAGSALHAERARP